MDPYILTQFPIWTNKYISYNIYVTLIWSEPYKNEMRVVVLERKNTYCSNEDGRASPVMKRRSFYPRVQGHNSSV